MVALPENTSNPEESIINLYRYQRDFVADKARVVVGIWCRQAGKDFSAALKAVDDALETGQAWYIISLSQRQADATFDKCKKIAEVYKQALRLTGRITSADDAEYLDHDAEIDQYFRCQSHTLKLPGGGSVTSLPGRNPDTLAGLTGNIILTEFGLFPRGGYNHWRVVFPLATRGFQVVVISTPRGKNTKFYELVSNSETFSVHFVDIHRAMADGMPLTDKQGKTCSVEEFRKIYSDEAGWQREYLCQFAGDLEALVTWSQLVEAGLRSGDAQVHFCRIENEVGYQATFFAELASLEGRLEMGWDVARTGDLSSLWINHRAPGGWRNLVALVLMHKTTFALQRQVVSDAMEIRGHFGNSVGCGDATGLGMDSNETLHARYGDRWVGVAFTAASKREMASAIVTAFHDGNQGIPPLDGAMKFVATDLYALQADRSRENLVVSESVNALLPESHCDLAWSCGLARRAATLAGAEPYCSVL